MYAALSIRLLNKLSRADTVQSLLSLISDMLAGARPRPRADDDELTPRRYTDHDERIPLFLALPESPYTPLLKYVEHLSRDPQCANADALPHLRCVFPGCSTRKTTLSSSRAPFSLPPSSHPTPSRPTRSCPSSSSTSRALSVRDLSHLGRIGQQLTQTMTGNTNDPEGQDVGVQCLEGILAVEKVRTDRKSVV